MGIIQLPTQLPGAVGVLPNQKFLVTTDNLATVSAAGYLNQVSLESNPVSNTDVMQVLYSYNLQTTVGTYGVFTVSISNGVITLTVVDYAGEIVVPTIANHIATFTNTTGTISEDPTTAISGGNIQAGLSGTAGYLASFPATSAKGSFRFTAVANTGNTLTTLSNNAMGQASVINFPDPANAIAQVLVGATATPFVSGNFPQNSGTVGLMVDSGLAVSNVVSKIAANVFSGSGQITLAKVSAAESANAVTASGNAGYITTSSLTVTAGSTYAITWTNTKITATSVIGLCVQGGSNTNQNINFTCAAGTGTATLTIYNSAPSTSISGTIIIGYSVL